MPSSGRSRTAYPGLKYPLHNAKQIAEMEEIARLTRDAGLLRYVRSYTALDRPAGGEGQDRYVGSLWRDHVEARLEVLERADMLVQVSRRSSVSKTVETPAGVTPNTARPSSDRDGKIVDGWLAGGWTPEQMRDSLACFESDGVRLHAGRYLRAREFFSATGGALAECREGTSALASRPALEDSHLTRIDRLAGGEVAAVGERERTFLLDLASTASAELEADPRRTARLLESSLSLDVSHGWETGRTGGAHRSREVFRPHDDEWAGRLAGLLVFRETEGLASAVSGASRERFDATREDVYEKRRLLELTREVRAASGMTPDAPAAALGAAEERAIERCLRAVGDGLRSRGAGWKEWQAEGVGEFKHAFPERDREKAGHVIEEVKARLEEERRTEALRLLLPQFDSAARLYLHAAYHDEGLGRMREPSRRREHVRELAERFSRAANEAGHDPERLGLARGQLEARAGGAVMEAVERFGREERETFELGRLEARMILACAERDEAATRLRRFADHAPFHTWGYRTRDGHGSTSLCEALFTLNDETDRAALLVAEDAAGHVTRRIDQGQAELVEVVTTRAAEATAATHAYEAREAELSRPEVTTRGPVFEPGELKRLEEAAFVTRDPALTGLVARREEEVYGPEYAASRALGRALRAAAVWGAEHDLPARYERPVAPGRLDGLREPAREFLSSQLDRHRAAREAERAAADSFRTGVEAQANVRAGAAPRTPRGTPTPLVTEAEAREIFARWGGMSTQQRRSWDRMTMYAEVAVEGDGRDRGGTRSLQEWAIRNIASITCGSEYERFIGDAKVLSYNDARGIVRQREKDHSRNRSLSTRSR